MVIWMCRANVKAEHKPPVSGRSHQFLCADISKITYELGWEPKYTLEEGLDKTIGWYRKEHGGSKYDWIKKPMKW